MSALARYFAHEGYRVAGYDRTATAITDKLQEEEIQVHFKDELDDAPNFLYEEAGKTYVIYTPAIPHDHTIMGYCAKNNYPLKKRSAVLGDLSKVFYTIAVGGAHGKTSTSAFIAHALTVAGIPFYGFLGGIAANYDTNFLKPIDHSDVKIMLTEADEYDRSFLNLEPAITILTSTDADHLDIYETAEALQQAYQDFTGRTKSDGRVAHPIKFQLPKLKAGVKTVSFGLKSGDYQAKHIKVANNQYQFTIANQGENIRLCSPAPGQHNILNITAAAAGLGSWLDSNTLQEAVKTYQGVKRRFEIVKATGTQVLIDDYAHHPKELAYTIQTIRELYPEGNITGLFQPHLYSRTRDFAPGFAQSLAALDRVVLLPIYPARETEMPGVSSKLIYNKLSHADKHLIEKNEVENFIEKDRNEVIVTLGAGDISDLVQPIAKAMEKRLN